VAATAPTHRLLLDQLGPPAAALYDAIPAAKVEFGVLKP
jgi:hypothetical protein